MNKVCIVGMGPGAADYLSPMAKREIGRAECLIGSQRLISRPEYAHKKKIGLEGCYKEAMTHIKKNRARERIAVLVSGDPGLYSFLGTIRKVLRQEEYAVIPGISTMQLAFARIGESWQDSKIISLHGRRKRGLAGELRSCAKAFLFTDSKFPPEKIAGYLLRNGIKKRRAVVFENLTYPNEKIVDTDLNELSNMRGFGLCSLIIIR